MGLRLSIQDVLKVTQKISSLANGNFHTGANIPTGKLGRILGMDENISLNSVSDLRNALTLIRLGVATASTMLYCAYVMTLKGAGSGTWGQNLKQQWGGFAMNLVSGAAGVMMDVYKQISEAVAAQIGMAIGQIVGVVTNLVTAFSNMISSIILLVGSILELIKNWTSFADWIWEVEIEAENCKDMLSAIAACYLNKLLGPYIELFTSKIVGKINEAGNNLNEMLFLEFQDVNMLSSYVNQLAFLLEKASLQIKGLTKLNLLGGREYETR